MKGKKMTGTERRVKAERDAKERSKIFSELCSHVRNGYSLMCFPPISEHTVRKWLKEYPEEFIEGELELAIRAGQVGWEEIGRKQSNGSCLGNSRSWYYNMVNRYGWREKVDIAAEHKGQVSVNVISYATSKTSQDSGEDDSP